MAITRISETFTVDCIQYEIRSVDKYEMVILMLGVKPKILIYNVAKNITVDQAQCMVRGFLDGHREGRREAKMAINRIFDDPDLENRWLKERYDAQETAATPTECPKCGLLASTAAVRTCPADDCPLADAPAKDGEEYNTKPKDDCLRPVPLDTTKIVKIAE